MRALRWLKSGALGAQSRLLHFWLGAVSLCVLYNLIFLINRLAFSQLTEYQVTWMVLDYFCDLLYVLDMLVSVKTGYLCDGILITDYKKQLTYYMRSWKFKFDILSVLPTEFGYLHKSVRSSPALRINRLLRVHRLNEFFDKTIQRASNPALFRISHLLLYILLIIHWNGCIYYGISNHFGFGSTVWVYPNQTYSDNLADFANKYVYSFYWSALTLLALGETPHPVKDSEFLITISELLVGLLIIATIVGNVGSLVTNMNLDQMIFTNHLDCVKRYMKLHRVTDQVNHRIIRWFGYIWEEGLWLDEEQFLHTLPANLRAEIAIETNTDILREVKIFKDCESGLLNHIMAHLSMQTFCPGDYICKTGDIGRSMYIIKSGILKVFNDSGQVFTTLTSGSVFGELSLLDLPGRKLGNRRSANVMSVGYADCFTLSKADLWNILQEYPMARRKFINIGREMLKDDNLLDNCNSSAEGSQDDRLDVLRGKIQAQLKHLNAFYDQFIQEQAQNKQRITNLEKMIGVMPPNMIKKSRRQCFV